MVLHVCWYRCAGGEEVVRKLALILVWLVEDPEAYEGKTNADVEKEILEMG